MTIKDEQQFRKTDAKQLYGVEVISTIGCFIVILINNIFSLTAEHDMSVPTSFNYAGGVMSWFDVINALKV